MKHSITLALALVLALSSISCASKHRQYTIEGIYYHNGTIVTEDGNEWVPLKYYNICSESMN